MEDRTLKTALGENDVAGMAIKRIILCVCHPAHDYSAQLVQFWFFTLLISAQRTIRGIATPVTDRGHAPNDVSDIKRGQGIEDHSARTYREGKWPTAEESPSLPAQ